MSVWPSTKAARVLAALLRIGWQIIDYCINNATMGVQEEDTHATTQGFG
jgi:hypothetical protein